MKENKKHTPKRNDKEVIVLFLFLHQKFILLFFNLCTKPFLQKKTELKLATPEQQQQQQYMNLKEN